MLNIGMIKHIIQSNQKIHKIVKILQNICEQNHRRVNCCQCHKTIKRLNYLCIKRDNEKSLILRDDGWIWRILKHGGIWIHPSIKQKEVFSCNDSEIKELIKQELTIRDP